MCMLLINTKVMFFHAGIFVLMIFVNSLTLVNKQEETSYQNILRIETCPRFDLHHQVGGNLALKSSILGSIFINEQVETLH